MESVPAGLVVRLLGPVEVWVADKPVRITQQALLTVLALLALAPNRVVSASALIDGLWQEEPTRPRERNLHAHVYQLRKRLISLEPDRGDARLITRQPGYQLILGPDESDVAQFTALAARGRDAGRSGDPAAAASLLGQALGLWRGPALADVADLSDRLAVDAATLEEQRLAVQADYADAALAAGRHGELISELAAQVAQHPLRERLRSQLMLALYRAGRQAEALACYQEGRQVLDEELGVEPGPELKDLQQKILRADPALALPAATQPAGSASSPEQAMPGGYAAPIVPRQLPAGVRHFAGREAEIAHLDALLDQALPSGTVVITAIGGTGGVGKTALALHWAHKVADRFPDGQLHVNLRGYDPGGSPVSPAEAIRRFLDALGIPAGQVPQAPDAQAALYRTVLADRRMLILLDNARDAAQVRPLLPAAAGCLVVVTSRSALTGLSTTEGAVPVPLGLVSPAEAEAMLIARLGPRRIAAEPAAVAWLIELCARLPLALAITAARAAASPATPLAAFAAEMSSEEDRLDAFDVGDPVTSVRAVFSWSISQLSDGAGRMFRLLGLHPGPDASLRAAASLAGLPRPEARRLVTELAGASLVTEHVPGRYAFHDLLRAYAAEQAAAIETAADRQVAIRRVLDYYLHTAKSAGAAIFGEDLPLPTLAALADPAVNPQHMQHNREAIAWFDAEHSVLIGATELAVASGYDSYAWQIPCTMTQYFRAVGRNRDWVSLNRIALTTAARLGDDDALGRVHFSIGTRCRITGAFDDAISHLNMSMSNFGATNDLAAQASVHLGISKVHVSQRPTLSLPEVAANGRAALAHASEALAIYRQIGSKIGQERALIDLADHHLALGELLTASDCCTEAIQLGLEISDAAGEVEAAETLGRINYGLGRYSDAVACYLRALSGRSEAGYPMRPPNTLEDLGDAYLADGNATEARAAWREVIDIGRQLEHISEEPTWRQARVLAKLEQLERGAQQQSAEVQSALSRSATQ